MIATKRSLLNFPERSIKSLVTPLAFSRHSGHFLSSIKGMACDKLGNPIPMYTYPAIDFLLANKEMFSAYKILEWGSGQSTLWWEKYVCSVISIEQSISWAEYIKKNLTEKDTVNIIICQSKQEFTLTTTELLKKEKFDLIVIDGTAYAEGSRLESAQASLPLLNPNGLIIVDNSDLKSLKPVNELLYEEGFGRIDFYGYSPGAFHKQCTSFFFRPESKTNILRSKQNFAVCSPLSLSF